MVMKRKRIGVIILNIFFIIIGIYVICDIVYGLIFDTKETLISVVSTVIFIIMVIVAGRIHATFKCKDKIDWNKYPELESICGWLYFFSWLFLGVSINDFFSPINVIASTGEPIYSTSASYFLLSIFSFWSYISLIMAKRNALFILRAYLISMASLLVMIQTVICSKRLPDLNLACVSSQTIEQIIYFIIVFILISAIFALCIKGLIISFSSHIAELFKDLNFSYWQILVMILLWASIITVFNTNITFTKETQSDYPALNVSK